MQKFVAKVLVLLSILANFIIFLITIVSIIFIALSTNAIQEFQYYIHNPLTWAGTIFTVVSIIYSLIISIIATIDLIKGKDMRNVTYNYLALFPILIASGITVFGFLSLSNIYFEFYTGIYIATVILNFLLFLSTLLINKKRL